MSKKALVIGLEKSGLAAYQLLEKEGYHVTISVNTKLSEETKKELKNAHINDGEHDFNLVDEHWDIIVKNPGIPYQVPFIKALVDKGYFMYSEIEIAYQYQPENTYLAISGTNGKTTTTTLLTHILESALPNVYSAGNIGVPLAKQVLEHSAPATYCLELSSFQIMGLKEFKPKIATILNLSPDHLDYMPSLDSYYKSKQPIYQNQDESDYFLLNIDDDNVLKYYQKNDAQVITFSLQENADACLKDDYLYYYDEAIIDIKKVQIVGKHNLYNVIVAIIFAKLMNIETKTIQKAVYSFQGVKYRIQKVEPNENDSNIYYNDSKSTTPDCSITALNIFENEPVILIVGGFNKGLDFSELVKAINEKTNLDKVYLYGQIAPLIKGIKKPVIIMDTIDDVVKDIKEKDQNKIVVFSCGTSSFDQFNNYEERGAYFNEIIKKY